MSGEKNDDDDDDIGLKIYIQINENRKRISNAIVLLKDKLR